MKVSICACRKLIYQYAGGNFEDKVGVIKHQCSKNPPAGKQVGAQATNVDRGVEAGRKESLLEQKEESFKGKETLSAGRIISGTQHPFPKSAVKNTVRIRSATLIAQGSLSNNIVIDGSEERLACIFDSEFFVKRFITNKNPLRKPISQEDFKAVLYACGGPVPSKVDKVETKPDESGNWVCIMWRMK